MEPIGSLMRHSLALIRAADGTRGRVRALFTRLPIFFSLLEVVAMEALGRTRWSMAEGCIPSESSSPDRTLISHETACTLDATDRDAHGAITDYASVFESDVPIVVQHTRLDSYHARVAVAHGACGEVAAAQAFAQCCGAEGTRNHNRGQRLSRRQRRPVS
jgi:hypothetical protein